MGVCARPRPAVRLLLSCMATALLALPPAPLSAAAARYYGAPGVRSGGNGSMERPWDLATALAHPAAVKPGDTIWIRGGTYKGAFTSRLAGAPDAPIVLRQYPGERVVVDGAWGHCQRAAYEARQPGRPRHGRGHRVLVGGARCGIVRQHHLLQRLGRAGPRARAWDLHSESERHQEDHGQHHLSAVRLRLNRVRKRAGVFGQFRHSRERPVQERWTVPDHGVFA